MASKPMEWKRNGKNGHPMGYTNRGPYLDNVCSMESNASPKAYKCLTP